MFTVDGLLRGARRALPVGLGGIAEGLVLGVLAGRAGLSVLEVLLMSSLVFAGSSQFVAISMWVNPIPAFAIVATTLLVNLRHVLMGLTLSPWYAKLPAPLALGTSFFMTDESWALTTVETQRKPFDAAFMLGAGLVVFITWVGSTVLGRITGAVIRDPTAWGLDFAFVAVFLALLVSLAKGKRPLAILPWGVAALIAVASQRLLPGNWYVLLGAISGGLVAVVLRGNHA